MSQVKKKSLVSNIDWFMTIAITVLIIGLGLLMSKFPDQSVSITNKMLWGLLNNTGGFWLVFTLVVLIVCVAFAFSKYGNVRLGKDEPKFSKGSLFFMVTCASFGAAVIYWCFLETGFYAQTPPFNLEPFSTEAYEWAIAYNQFHYGPSAWAMMIIFAIPYAFSMYIIKNRNTSLSGVMEAVVGKKIPMIIRKLVDLVFLFCTIGAVSMSFGLALPVISGITSNLLGIENSIMISVTILLAITVLYTLSSYVGLEKGMAKISTFNIYLGIAIIVLVFLVSDKVFTMNYLTNGFALMLNNYMKMSLWTDPIIKSGFPEGWTVFYMAYWLIFGPFVGLFFAKISQGHTFRTMLVVGILAGATGSWVLFGVMQSYAVNLQITGVIDAPALLAAGDPIALIMSVLNTFPMSKVFMFLFVILGCVFCATTMDGSAYSLSSSTTFSLGEDETPNPLFKGFWCIILAIIPLVFVLIDAPLSAIKSIATTMSVPLAIIITVMAYSSIKGFVKMYGGMTKEEIINGNEPKEKEVLLKEAE
jgi:BCCT family betaine/carnitine transporter